MFLIWIIAYIFSSQNSHFCSFYLYKATFQQHLHTKYISLNWFNIPELVVSIRIFLIEGCCQQGSYWTKCSYWLSWNHNFESFTVATMTCLTVTEYMYHKWSQIYSTCLSTSRSFPPLWLTIRVVTRVIQQVPLVEQELPTLPEYLSSSPRF